MNRYKVMVRHSASPGSGFGWAYVNANTVFEALSMFKAMYGDLLLNECVQLA